MSRLLIIGHTLPESTTTAAGKRMLQLIRFFKEQGYQIRFATTAAASKFSDPLESLVDSISHIVLNSKSFDRFLQELQPQVVVFDRFMTEEQFGWRVAENCPEALRILDTEDLHFLRGAREEAFRKGLDTSTPQLHSDLAMREIASIYRCDLSLIISKAEMDLLVKRFSIPEFILCYLPLFAESVQPHAAFNERRDFVSIGNLRHRPNVDAVGWLYKEIWPLIRAELPKARLHVWGAYASNALTEINRPDKGFLVHGWAPLAANVLREARLCLAPLRFGAGLKGKVLDALTQGTPVVTTSIGAEGIAPEQDFPGAVAQTPHDLAHQAIRLYTDAELWELHQQRGRALLKQDFSPAPHLRRFKEVLDRLTEQLPVHRERNVTGKLMWYHGLQASRYLSKWIACKNREDR